MTVYRQYRCNLCTDYMKPTENTPREGWGVKFAPLRSERGGGTWMDFTRPEDAEKHICLRCAKAVHDELRKVMPAPIVRVTHP